MTQPITQEYMVASFAGSEDQRYTTIQEAMRYAETLTKPNGYIGYVPDEGVNPIVLVLYVDGNASEFVSGGVSPGDYYGDPSEEEWP